MLTTEITATMTSREKKLANCKKGLYLCLFDQGTLKIGMGTDVAVRLTAHKSAGAVLGIGVARTDIIQCDNAAKAEKLLIEWCGKNSSKCTGREWFSGVDYFACLEVARAIAASMMGPHPFQPPRRNFVEALIESYKTPKTAEAEAYEESRVAMLEKAVPTGVIQAFDILHRACEKIRTGMRMGCVMPKWFDELNCFGAWEIELWFDKGSPNSELLRAAADVIEKAMASS
jgi:hypothetical protein